MNYRKVLERARRTTHLRARENQWPYVSGWWDQWRDFVYSVLGKYNVPTPRPDYDNWLVVANKLSYRAKLCYEKALGPSQVQQCLQDLETEILRLYFNPHGVIDPNRNLSVDSKEFIAQHQDEIVNYAIELLTTEYKLSPQDAQSAVQEAFVSWVAMTSSVSFDRYQDDPVRGEILGLGRWLAKEAAAQWFNAHPLPGPRSSREAKELASPVFATGLRGCLQTKHPEATADEIQKAISMALNSLVAIFELGRWSVYAEEIPCKHPYTYCAASYVEFDNSGIPVFYGESC